MFASFKDLFTKNKRVLALVFQDGTVHVFTKQTFDWSSPVASFVDHDLSLVGVDDKMSVQSMEVDIYDDVIHYPHQTLYSIPYDAQRKPERTSILPESVWLVVWNYLEGAKGEMTPLSPNTFKMKASA